MQRRSFLAICGALGGFNPPVARAAAEKKTRFYVLEQFFMKNGPQTDRLNEFMSTAVLPALNEAHSGPKIYLQALVAPHMPQLAAIYGFESLDHMWQVHTRISQNKELMKKEEEFESRSEDTFEYMNSALLEAADYSPEIVVPSKPPETPRVFELRVYHSPTWRQLQALHERFAGPEIKIFHRVGVHPILYSSTVIGPQLPNLTYLIPFENLAAREKAWNAFGADPEWVKVRKESVEKHGQISSVIQISLYKATPYSPVR